ncbi:PEP-CTERM sorting domain-containing protein [Congregibacter sp.]|uniref:PEP-CTERM sorting domain-containing protein n=2 Tax=Congregibacter sp. TaxID=2744308 RepID=UPI0039E2E2BB
MIIESIEDKSPMKPITLLVSTVISLSVSNLAMGVADPFGEYTLGDVRIDGTTWTDSSTEVTIGESFALEIDLSYTSSPLILLEHEYFANQSVELFIGSPGGESLGSALAATPESSSTDTGFLDGVEYVTSAAWTLVGTGLFDISFGDAGIYDVFFQRTPGSYETGDGLSPNFVEISQELSAKVPAPATLLLLVAGIFGLLHTRRSRQA